MRRPSALHGAAILLVAGLAAGCTSTPNDDAPRLGWLSPHRISIQQGNVVTQDQLARVKPGMSRLQVRDALGTPLLTDAFHANRWDYVFTFRQGNQPMLKRSVVLIFDGDVLKSIDAPELPTERQFIDSIARSGRLVAAAELELTPDQLRALPVPARTAPGQLGDSIPNPIPSTRTFPPLELP